LPPCDDDDDDNGAGPGDYEGTYDEAGAAVAGGDDDDEFAFRDDDASSASKRTTRSSPRKVRASPRKAMAVPSPLKSKSKVATTAVRSSPRKATKKAAASSSRADTIDANASFDTLIAAGDVVKNYVDDIDDARVNEFRRALFRLFKSRTSEEAVTLDAVRTAVNADGAAYSTREIYAMLLELEEEEKIMLSEHEVYRV